MLLLSRTMFCRLPHYLPNVAGTRVIFGSRAPEPIASMLCKRVLWTWLGDTPSRGALHWPNALELHPCTMPNSAEKVGCFQPCAGGAEMCPSYLVVICHVGWSFSYPQMRVPLKPALQKQALGQPLGQLLGQSPTSLRLRRRSWRWRVLACTRASQRSWTP